MVDATGWTQIGLIDLKWDDFLNYRIDPCFFSTDLGVIVNLDRWNELSEEARTDLQDVGDRARERTAPRNLARVGEGAARRARDERA